MSARLRPNAVDVSRDEFRETIDALVQVDRIAGRDRDLADAVRVEGEAA
jgi:hypothetical protein